MMVRQATTCQPSEIDLVSHFGHTNVLSCELQASLL